MSHSEWWVTFSVSATLRMVTLVSISNRWTGYSIYLSVVMFAAQYPSASVASCSGRYFFARKLQKPVALVKASCNCCHLECWSSLWKWQHLSCATNKISYYKQCWAFCQSVSEYFLPNYHIQSKSSWRILRLCFWSSLSPDIGIFIAVHDLSICFPCHWCNYISNWLSTLDIVV
jgi:hypothetical protein